MIPVPIVSGHVHSEEKGGHEVEKGGPEDGVFGRQHPGRNDGRNGVGRIVKAVQEIEYKGHENDEDDEKAWRGYPCFSTMPSTMLETSSQMSMASSIRS